MERVLGTGIIDQIVDNRHIDAIPPTEQDLAAARKFRRKLVTFIEGHVDFSDYKDNFSWPIGLDCRIPTEKGVISVDVSWGEEDGSDAFADVDLDEVKKFRVGVTDFEEDLVLAGEIPFLVPTKKTWSRRGTLPLSRQHASKDVIDQYLGLLTDMEKPEVKCDVFEYERVGGA